MKTKGTVILFTLAFLLGASLFIAGCELKGKDEGAQLPTRGYGTFKMHIEDLGPVREVNEAGQFTGRRGFNFDADEDGVAENFYQIDKPTGGIVALSFDQVTGEANGGLPVAMQLFRAGQQDYEIPLQSLTSWIKIDQALGYRRAQYVDQPDILVYEDRIADKQLEAPMTGARRLSGVGSFGPFSSLSRSTICRKPPLSVP